MRLIVAMSFACSLIAATQPATQDPVLLQLVELSRSAPAEFAAMSLTQIVTSTRMKEREWKIALLKEAFETAQGAQDPYPKRIILGELKPGGALRRHVGYQRKLDRLSLQSAVIKAMIPLQPALAYEMYQQIQPPRVPAAACADALIADPGEYFRLTAAVAQALPPAQRAKGEHLALVERALASVSSASALVPALQMAQGLQVNLADQTRLIARWAGMMEAIPDDDRSFSATLHDVEAAVEQLSRAESSKAIVVPAFRRYLASHFQTARCAESTDAKWPYIAEQKALGTKYQLSDAEQKASRNEGTVNWEIPEPDLEGDKLQEQWKALLFNGKNSFLPEAEKAKSEWRAKLTDVIAAFDSWQPAGVKSDDEAAARKVTFLAGLLWIIPAGEDRDRVLDRLVTNLRISGSRPESWAVWFADLDGLLNMTQTTQSTETNRVLDAFERSGHPVLLLYSQMLRKLGTGRPDWAIATNATN